MIAANPFGRLICVALTVAWILLLIRVVVSWLEYFGVRPPVSGPLRGAYTLLYDVTEPGLRPLRKVVPQAGMFDLSVLVAFVIIFVFQAAFC
ncbi:MAG TPA: YggT family protein [Actinomycetota bacterium]|jgi:YggT family protein|nr:YggT family protein [Actinomycetota bacterium]